MQDAQSDDHRRRFRQEEAIFILLLSLSLLGIGITQFSAEDGYAYWLFMVFIFGTLATSITWLKAKKGQADFAAIIKEQSLHWGYSLIVVGGAFLLQKSGKLDAGGASLVVLLILALSTMLDGIRIGWQFSLLGFFLGACALLIAYIEKFMLAAIILAIAIIGGTLLWENWFHKRAYK